MDVTDAAPVAAAATPVATEPADVARIRSLVREQKFAEAVTAGEDLLRRVPDDRDALLCVAVSQARYLRRIDAALATLGRLEQQHPPLQPPVRGARPVLRGDAPGGAGDRCLPGERSTWNYALPGSWGMLEGLYRMTGQGANADTAAAHVATMRKQPQEIVTAISFFEDGDLDAAEAVIRAWLIKHGDHVEAMRLLARIGMARKVFDDPELLLKAVVEQAPGYRAARQEYAAVLVELPKHQEGISSAR